MGLGLGTTSLLSRASDRPLLGTTDDRESVSEPLEVTAVSRIHRTRRIHEVTGGHEEDPIRVQEEPRGHHGTREDTRLCRFGTVRPRVQIPGPRPVFEFRTVKCRYTASERRSRGVTGRSRRLPSVGPPCASRPVCEERARDAESGDHAARQKWTRIVDACER